MNPTRTTPPIALILVALLVTACGGITAGQLGEEGASVAQPDQTSIQFSWAHTIEFAGFYAAEDAGYYAEENLDVDLRAGGFDDAGNYLDPIGSVVSGTTDFGDTDAGVVLAARADGAPLVAIASIYQRHPLAFVSLAENNIVKPEDLIGRTVDVSDNSVVMYQALLASQGIDPALVNSVTRADFTINPLVNGDIDVIDGWVTNETVELSQQGIAFNAILVSDYGIEVYPNVIFTTEDMIANHPDVVERFLRATVRGMQRAVDDPEYAAGLSVSYNDTLDLDKETEAMFQSLPLLNPAGSKPGMMDASAWQTTQDIMLEQGLLDEPLDLNTVYTLDFLNRIYAQ